MEQSLFYIGCNHGSSWYRFWVEEFKRVSIIMNNNITQSPIKYHNFDKYDITCVYSVMKKY